MLERGYTRSPVNTDRGLPALLRSRRERLIRILAEFPDPLAPLEETAQTDRAGCSGPGIEGDDADRISSVYGRDEDDVRIDISHIAD